MKAQEEDEAEEASVGGGAELKLDMINNLNSAKLLMISEQFDEYPGQEVDVQQFVDIMVGVMRGTEVGGREDFKEQLVDLFFRANKARAETIRFEHFTAFLIEHEIEMAGTQAQGGAGANMADMHYYEPQLVH